MNPSVNTKTSYKDKKCIKYFFKHSINSRSVSHVVNNKSKFTNKHSCPMSACSTILAHLVHGF